MDKIDHEAITIAILDEHIALLKQAFKEAGGEFPTFSPDPVKERRKVLKLIRAMKRTRAWFVSPEEA